MTPPRDRDGGGSLWGAALRLGRDALAPADRFAQVAGPVPALLRRDPVLARIYLRHAPAVLATLGEEAARGYGGLVRDALDHDPEMARALALGIPDALARVAPDHRPRYLVALGWCVREHPEAAVAASQNLPELLATLDDPTLRSFLARGSTLLRESAEKARSFLRVESEAAHQALHDLRPGTALTDVSRILSLYARAHSGAEVRLQALPPGASRRPLLAWAAVTDGHEVWLPERVDVFGDERDFLVYRVTTGLAVGHLEAGTFDLVLDDLPGPWPPERPGESEVERLVRVFPHPALATDLFHLLEAARVEAALRDRQPGFARDLDALRRDLPVPDPAPDLSPAELALDAAWRRSWGRAVDVRLPTPVAAVVESLDALRRGLQAPGTAVDASVRALRDGWPLLAALVPAAPSRSPGGRLPAAAALDPARRSTAARALDDRIRRLLRQRRSRGEAPTVSALRRELTGRPTDYEEVDAWLEAHPAPGGGIVERSDRAGQVRPPPPVLLEGVVWPPDPRTFVYPEWDWTIDDYRPGWVRVREYPLARGSTAFAEEVARERRVLLHTLRRQFEALRPPEVTLVRGLVDGDTLDLDRAVDAVATRRAGGAPSERLYAHHQRHRRDVAVAFLLDMSSSTNEVVSAGTARVMQVEKEALLLIAEAVHAIGDAFAIWGWSGFGREQVAFYVAKDFRDPFDDAVRERIGRMSWKMENRDGAAIRHATRKLLAWPARVRLLLLLSDGKPLDCGCDRYADRYAVEDTRVALQEARKAGLHPFCITVDPLGQDYLRHMYGETSYTIIDRVEALPLRLPTLYRRLTR